MRYEVQATREDGWWMITIPAIDGLTQARRRDDIEREARDYIVVTEDVPPSHVCVEVTSVVVDGVDYSAQLRQEREERDRADDLAVQARAHQAQIATDLNNAGVPMREIAGMLELSHQRVHQLIATSRETSAA